MNLNIENDHNAQIIFQSYITCAFLFNLKKSNFLNSEYFNSNQYEEIFPIKESIKKINIDNQGFLVMSLYALLVLPKEKFYHNNKQKFDKIEKFLLDKVNVEQDNYVNKPHILHLRNAIAHSNIEIIPEDSLIFKDKYKKQIFEASIPLSEIPQLIMLLIELLQKYNELKK